jgi:glycosyltransferase involved in cell wall biosynthesis
MPKTPLVSVVMPVYNQEEYLPAAIESVLAQSYSNIELLIVDDGSTDLSGDICEAYASQDPRITIMRQKNAGPSKARNTAIAMAKGAYICLLDADDLMVSEKIMTQLNVMLKDPEIDISYTALLLIDSQGNFIGEIHSQEYSQEDFVTQMFFRNVIPNPNTIMAKSTCLKQNLYNETFKHGEDFELMLRLAQQFRFKYIDMPLTSYRRHTENLSNDLTAHRKAELRVLKNYSKEHIKTVIDKSLLPKKEKQLMCAKIFYNMEFFEEALGIFQLIDSAISLFYQGNCHLKLNQLALAKESYQKSLELDSSNAACHNNLGVVFAKLGDKMNAKIAFQKACELKPGYLDAKMNLENSEGFCITWRELRTHLMPYEKK